MQQIDAVVFDWGGTLSVHVDIDLHEIWAPCAAELSSGQAEELCELLFVAEQRAWARGYDDQASCRLADLLVATASELGIAPDDELLELAMGRYFEQWNAHVVHEPDAAAVVAELSRAGLKTGLLSNTHWPREFHERLLERDGLSEHIDVRCYSSELTHTKPHPLAFTAVLDELGVEATRAVFVGDRPFDDI
jgi:FMN phosphatase YigB (HAD superfamily)